MFVPYLAAASRAHPVSLQAPESAPVFGGVLSFLEGHGDLVIMEKKMETTIYYLGFI